MVLGINAQIWLNLEIIYREKIDKIKTENNMEQDIRKRKHKKQSLIY